MPSLVERLVAATRSLAAAGVPDPAVDARLLLLAATGLDRLALIRDPDREMPDAAAARLAGWLARRAAREPVSRILGTRGFWGLTLRVTPAVLDPRPDTEMLVEAVLDTFADRRDDGLNLLDLGTGSGAILCALLTELPRATGWAVDRSAAACAVARSNLAACGLAERSLVLQGDWGTALAPGCVDIVVSNPPYIETAAIAGLDRDVREHDPWMALDGGTDGLDAYRRLALALPRLLAPRGVVALEVGQEQYREVSTLLAASGLTDIATRRDLGGIDRVVLARAASTFSGRDGPAFPPSPSTR